MLPKGYFVPKGVDDFVASMNRGVEYSLLDCPGRQTVKVAPVRKRHGKIREIVQAQQFVTIETLAQICSVTPQTIRRDIAVLSKNGQLTRYHGGVALPTSTENVAYNQRKVICFREKQKQVLWRNIAPQNMASVKVYLAHGQYDSGEGHQSCPLPYPARHPP